MINSVSNSAPVNQWHTAPTPPTNHAAKSKKAEPQDSVVLSPQAKAATDPDHDGD